MHGRGIFAFGFDWVNWVSERHLILNQHRIELPFTLLCVVGLNILCRFVCFSGIKTVMSFKSLAWYLVQSILSLCSVLIVLSFLFIFTIGCHPQRSSFISSIILLETCTYFISWCLLLCCAERGKKWETYVGLCVSTTERIILFIY